MDDVEDVIGIKVVLASVVGCVVVVFRVDVEIGGTTVEDGIVVKVFIVLDVVVAAGVVVVCWGGVVSVAVADTVNCPLHTKPSKFPRIAWPNTVFLDTLTLLHSVSTVVVVMSRPVTHVDEHWLPCWKSAFVHPRMGVR